MELDIWSSTAIVVGFSVALILLDEYVVKRWREKRWEDRAKSGDREAQELLRVAKSAKVVEE